MFTVGIVGYGVVGQRRHKTLQQFENFKVVAVSDKIFSEDTAPKNLKWYSDFKDLILNEKIDVLLVCLPNKFAVEATLLGLKNDMHVFCEKPPARSVAELIPIHEFMKTSNRKLMYGFNHRFHASVMEAKLLIDSKKLGSIVNLKGTYGKSKMISFNQTDWRTDRDQSGGGILLDQGIHMLDLMRYFAGDFTKVFSVIKNNFWNFDVEDNAYVLMETADQVVAQLHSSATQWRHVFNLEITLQKGSIILGGLLTSSKSYGSETLKIIYSDPDIDQGNPQETIDTFEEDISWDQEMACFTSAVKNSDNIENGSVEEAMKIMELIEKIYQSDPEWQAKYY